MTELSKRFLETLARTQWLSPDRLAAYQRRLLTDLVAHARATTPYYRDSGRLDALFRADGTVDLADWEKVPILTRQDAREAGRTLHAEAVPEAAGASHEWQTSGSTGSPFFFLRSAALLVASGVCLQRSYDWHGLDGGKTMAAITLSTNPGDAGETRWYRSDAEGRIHFFQMALRTEPILPWLARTGAAYVLSYPTVARDLARDILAGRHPPVPVDQMFTFCEMLTPDTRAEIAAGFGCKVADRYAAEEVGTISLECEHGNHHIQSETCLVEIVDDAGRPVPAGTMGHVVITAFYNYAMPLLRYAIGDIAAISDAACPCGRSLPVLKAIGGRARDQFRFVDGRVTLPYVPFYKLSALLPFRQLQIVQDTLEDVTLVYVPEGNPEFDRDAVTAFVRQHLHPGLNVRFRTVDAIPREAGGKYRDYVCNL